ncbi:hypothetical protein IQ247_04625 [Plectonema cf. radiosum LEGE 06105]|uniref:Uncharacterized protein n=1 Tax=Plectonema cf. radiosum LEGE 06105 TaxID=945769 RepID=A0A8J7F9F7_9CYAN|nr:hypothetical protein [Plectonema radiosum]MBE9212003.1 hypothetical protein [Plectonema cf. radiosum LEGE 06105]
MAEEAKDKNESQQENHSEKQDNNRLPYQPPTLRKHGKINNTTKSTVIAIDIDGFFNFTDLS